MACFVEDWCEKCDSKHCCCHARKEFRHNSDVAEMLCLLLKHIYKWKEEKDISNDYSLLDFNKIPGIYDWWEEHKEIDLLKELKENE